MPTLTVNWTVAGAPLAADIPAGVLAAVKSVYPAATVAYPYADLFSIEPAPGSGGTKTNLGVRVTFPSA